jgi:hypothetical protein
VASDWTGSILLKNSSPKFREKNFDHEKAVAVEFLCETSFSATLVVKRFLKNGYFLTSEQRERVFQQNRSTTEVQTQYA